MVSIMCIAQSAKNLLQCRRPSFESWVRKIPGEGNGNPLQCSSLENSMDRGACQGHKELDMTERLNHHHTAHAFPNNRKEQSELKSEVRCQLHLLYCGLSSSGRSPKQQNIHKTDTQTCLQHNIKD